MENIKLYIFGLYGTTTNTPFADHAPLAPLPGRKEKIARLQASGAYCTIAENSGGVAFGYTTEKKATEEVAGIAQQLGIEEFEVAFGHPKPKWGYEEYKNDYHMKRRKPEPGMLFALMEKYNVLPNLTMVVGNREEDKQAAEKACCNFMWAKDFFADQAELVAQIYGLFQQVAELQLPENPELTVRKDGDGEIGWHYRVPFVAWDELNQAPGAIQAAIYEHKKTVVAVVAGDDFDPFLDSDDLP